MVVRVDPVGLKPSSEHPYEMLERRERIPGAFEGREDGVPRDSVSAGHLIVQFVRALGMSVSDVARQHQVP